MSGGVSVFAAFVAGLLSFLSPCVLPLAAGYLLYAGGGLKRGADEPSPNRAAVSATAAFVLGFSCVFVVMGAVVSRLMLLLGGAARIVNAAAGLVVIALGLNILFNFIPFLNYEKTLFGTRGATGSIKRAGGVLGAFLAGLAFGAGWTPCVGPILSGILLTAGQGGRTLEAAGLLAVYSLGLGVPFMLIALFWDAFLTRLGKIKPLIPAIHTASGVFLVIMGALILFGRFSLLNAFLMKNGFALAAWADGGGAGVRLIPAAVLLALALIPLVVCAALKKPPRPPALVCSGVLLLLGALNALGAVNGAAALSRWLLFMGV